MTREERLERALRFYADDFHYRAGEITSSGTKTFIDLDRGKIAQAALQPAADDEHWRGIKCEKYVVDGEETR